MKTKEEIMEIYRRLEGTLELDASKEIHLAGIVREKLTHQVEILKVILEYQ